jgi:tRNA(Leu) C34 or U34 (ribose-2'-O)-methylase TrmL
MLSEPLCSASATKPSSYQGAGAYQYYFMRGYFAIGIYSAKTPANVGGLWRSAHAMGASYIFTIGARYPAKFKPTDTTKALKHVPLLEFDTLEEFWNNLPRDSKLVAVETKQPNSVSLVSFDHPDRAIYLLGAEDRGLSQEALEISDYIVEIPTKYCLNVASTGSIILYDRLSKS